MTAAATPPVLLVIIGATGDLTRRKLLPALGALDARGELPRPFVVLGVARDPHPDDAAFRAIATDALPGLDEGQIQYQPIGEGAPPDFARIAADITELERQHGLPGNRIFYLALPPQAFAPTIEALGAAGLNRSAGFTRVVVEKPFGRDLESARALNALLHRHFDEQQIYRIDHYLGKETVRNLMVFRFANPIFETQWNRDRIERVDISVAEAEGVGTRAGYYEQAGAVRDMLQNHVMQLLCHVAMEPPATFDADAVRDEKLKVLQSMQQISPDAAVLGQYEDYTGEPGVDAASATATFAAITARIDNWRWHGVPFVLSTGKRLRQRSTRIVVQFRPAPVRLFSGIPGCDIAPDRLTIFIQPSEGFALAFGVKEPGEHIRVRPEHLDFKYADAFGPLADAYETLLRDVMQGDQTLFVRADWVERSWDLFQPLLEAPPHPLKYAAGSWGPAEP
ncbi:MAG TPA: glucose-6-phosphate dehydrogenase [Vicinamibacterales bacterium]|nr:glucose-6-phosphate dehydrogenase [Vicinamibacterales bacterium]